MPPRRRLDQLLVARGLAPTRSAAQALIRRGAVQGEVAGTSTTLTKPAQVVPDDMPLRLTETLPYVSRAGEKLAAFFDAFPEIKLAGARFLDVGASTGGFTDCLLQRGALRAVCVDVGHGQLHAKLRKDPSVTNLEGLNARGLTPDRLPFPDYPLIVADLSFISLTKVLPTLWPLLQRRGHLVALIKPQFELDPATLAAGKGLVRDEADRQTALERILAFARDHLPEARCLGSLESPLTGGDGNHEFLAGWRKEKAPTS